MIDPHWAQAKNVLLVRLDNLGDVLVTTPAIRALGIALPDTRLTLLCSPVGAQASYLNPDLDGIIVAEVPWMDPWNNLPEDPEREAHLLDRIRSEAFDGAVIFTSFRQSSLPAAYLCYQAGIPLRLGASVEGSGSLLTTRFKHPADYTGEFPHEVQRSLDLLAAIGIASVDSGLVLSVPPAGEAGGSELWARFPSPRGPLVALHPGCSMPARTYPPDLFRTTVRMLVEQLDARVFVTGTGTERDLCEFVLGNVDRGLAQSIAGMVPFEVFCGLIQEADVTVCSNTGPMHVSAAVGTPVVTAFALTNPPEQWSPWGVPYRQLYQDVSCRICYSRECPYEHECLRGVQPSEIVSAVRELVGEGPSLPRVETSLVGAAQS